MTSTSNSDPSKNFKTTMPQPPIFNVKALARLGDIVIYRKMTERPTVDQKGMTPITNCTSCLSSYAHNVQGMPHSCTTRLNSSYSKDMLTQGWATRGNSFWEMSVRMVVNEEKKVSPFWKRRREKEEGIGRNLNLSNGQ